ncbi:MAG TPA: aldo/keto reductase [Chitinivibrionales bacterium]|jgi:predicted aldo/keto reductase-like oxidoreductase|nr:aldo/keto reductase [Chitinivibrionales bacterium]
MKYRTMGSLPWKVSALGFGCMRLPSRGVLRGVNEKASVEIIRHGIDLGINYVDTAYNYHRGNSERVLGKALQDGYRDKVRLATKLFMFGVRSDSDFDKYLDEQLLRLRTDHVDVYLFHMLTQGNFAKLKRLNLIDKMEKARAQGKILHVGFSFHDTLPLFREIVGFYKWDMAQIQYNYMDTAIQATTDGLAYAHAKGIAVVVMEPLKGGRLANPPAEAMDVISRAPVPRKPADWALQFLWNRPEVSCVLSGMGSRKMVDENCASADASGVGTLSAEENKVIEELANIYRSKIAVSCTACGYCMPCPSSVDIPQNFAFLNNKAFGKSVSLQGRLVQWMITRNYRKLARNKKELVRRANRGSANLCTKCNACVPKCPQHIQIPQELEKVRAAFS